MSFLFVACYSDVCPHARQGLPKRFQSFIFFAITDVTQFRQRLITLIPFITSTAQVLADEAAIAAHKASGAKGLLNLTGTNVAFSSKGLIAVRCV
jgi:DyP dimeric alpha+beta barrel domain